MSRQLRLPFLDDEGAALLWDILPQESRQQLIATLARVLASAFENDHHMETADEFDD